MLQDSQIFTTNRSSNRRLSRNSRELAPPTNQPVSIDSVVNPVVMTITDVGRSSSHRLRAPVQGSADGVVGDQEMEEGYAVQPGDNVGDIQTTQSGTGDEVTKVSFTAFLSDCILCKMDYNCILYTCYMVNLTKCSFVTLVSSWQTRIV